MIDSKFGIAIYGVYQHYKNKGFYKVVGIAYSCENTNNRIVIYNKCDENGIYKRIENERTGYIVAQPFYRELEEFKEVVINDKVELVPRFTFIKHIR
jgi:hypothetical protein